MNCIKNYGRQFWSEFPNPDNILETLRDDEFAYITSIETENHYILTKQLKHWTNINNFKVEEQELLEANYCQCMRTEDKDEYWGYWLECECGYKSNTDGATYCGRCGKKIQIISTTAKFEHYGER